MKKFKKKVNKNVIERIEARKIFLANLRNNTVLFWSLDDNDRYADQYWERHPDHTRTVMSYYIWIKAVDFYNSGDLNSAKEYFEKLCRSAFVRIENRIFRVINLFYGNFTGKAFYVNFFKRLASTKLFFLYYDLAGSYKIVQKSLISDHGDEIEVFGKRFNGGNERCFKTLDELYSFIAKEKKLRISKEFMVLKKENSELIIFEEDVFSEKWFRLPGKHKELAYFGSLEEAEDYVDHPIQQKTGLPVGDYHILWYNPSNNQYQPKTHSIEKKAIVRKKEGFEIFKIFNSHSDLDSFLPLFEGKIVYFVCRSSDTYKIIKARRSEAPESFLYVFESISDALRFYLHLMGLCIYWQKPRLKAEKFDKYYISLSNSIADDSLTYIGGIPHCRQLLYNKNRLFEYFHKGFNLSLFSKPTTSEIVLKCDVRVIKHYPLDSISCDYAELIEKSDTPDWYKNPFSRLIASTLFAYLLAEKIYDFFRGANVRRTDFLDPVFPIFRNIKAHIWDISEWNSDIFNFASYFPVLKENMSKFSNESFEFNFLEILFRLLCLLENSVSQIIKNTKYDLSYFINDLRIILFDSVLIHNRFPKMEIDYVNAADTAVRTIMSYPEFISANLGNIELKYYFEPEEFNLAPIYNSYLHNIN